MADRKAPTLSAGERDTLLAFLDYLRESVILKVADLDRERAGRPMVPSGTSLLGLVKHLTLVERWWFHVVFAAAAADVPDVDVAPEDTVDGLVAAYREVIAGSNAIAMACDDLDRLSATNGGEPPALRWILVHMIEETGRHAGHADILREMIDGTTGR